MLNPIAVAAWFAMVLGGISLSVMAFQIHHQNLGEDPQNPAVDLTQQIEKDKGPDPIRVVSVSSLVEEKLLSRLFFQIRPVVGVALNLEGMAVIVESKEGRSSLLLKGDPGEILLVDPIRDFDRSLEGLVLNEGDLALLRINFDEWGNPLESRQEVKVYFLPVGEKTTLVTIYLPSTWIDGLESLDTRQGV